MTSLLSAGLLASEHTALNPFHLEPDQPMTGFVSLAHALTPSGQTSKSKSGYLRSDDRSIYVKGEFSFEFLCEKFKSAFVVRSSTLFVQLAQYS